MNTSETVLPELLADRAWARRLAADSGIRVTLVRADGAVMADSSIEPGRIGALENHLGRPEVQTALARGRGMDVRRSATTGQPYVYVARTLSGPRGERLVFRLAELDRIAAQHRLSHIPGLLEHPRGGRVVGERQRE